MYSLHGVQKIHVYSEKRVIKSGAVGDTNAEEIRWLADKLVEYAKDWTDYGWAYLVDIGEMTPVSSEVSKELIKLHKRLEVAGCKAIAFIDPDVFVIAAQAKNHQRKSKVSYKEKHFRTEEEALAWAEKILQGK